MATVRQSGIGSPFAVVRAAYGAAMVLGALSYFGTTSDARSNIVLGSMALATAALMVASSLIQRHPAPLAWILLAAAAAIGATGFLVAGLEAAGAMSGPWAEAALEIALLVAFGYAAVSVAVAVRPRLDPQRLRLGIIDSLTAGVAMALVGIGVAFRLPGGVDATAVESLATSLPLAAMALTFVAAAARGASGRGAATVPALLVVGVAISAAASAVFLLAGEFGAGYDPGTVADAGFVVAIVLAGVAALRHDMVAYGAPGPAPEPLPRGHSRLRAMLLVGATVAAVMFVLAELLAQPDSALSAAGSCALLVLGLLWAMRLRLIARAARPHA